VDGEISTREIARVYGVDRRTVYRWKRVSDFPPVLSRAGSVALHSSVAVAKWVDETA
jgi:predicted DNA-binding transcriptional regulator AlpA